MKESANSNSGAKFSPLPIFVNPVLWEITMHFFFLMHHLRLCSCYSDMNGVGPQKPLWTPVKPNIITIWILHKKLATPAMVASTLIYSSH